MSSPDPARLHGFGPGQRIFQVRVTDLSVSCTWSSGEEDDHQGQRPRVYGKAMTERDSVAVVEKHPHPCREFLFMLDGYRDQEEVRRHWQGKQFSLEEPIAIPQLPADSDPGQWAQLLVDCENHLDHTPPSAVISFMENPALGLADQWLLECALPMATLHELTPGILDGSIAEIRLGIEWHPTLLSDPSAPAYRPVCFGVLKNRRTEAAGWTRSATWSPALPHPLEVERSLPSAPNQAFNDHQVELLRGELRGIQQSVQFLAKCVFAGAMFFLLAQALRFFHH